MAFTEDDEIRLIIRIGLEKGLKRIRGARRAFSEEERRSLAGSVLDQLRRSNYKIEPGKPAAGYGQHMMPTTRRSPVEDS